MRIQEFIGRVMGATVAPFALVGSLVRRKRILHPNGVVYRAEVRSIAQGGQLGQLGQRLAGTALVRLSGALRAWPQGKRGPDLLGVAIRFRSHHDVTAKSLPGDRDLLLATASSMPALVIAPFRTNVNDFLANEYYTLLPFELEGAGKVFLRLVPTQEAPAGADRRERLALAVARHDAVLRLEIQVKALGEPWLPVAAIDLRERLDLEDGELRFDPGSSTMGLVPSGVLQWLRPAVYAASHLGWRLTRGLPRASTREVGGMRSRPMEGELERR
jgi:hypothetical protein